MNSIPEISYRPLDEQIVHAVRLHPVTSLIASVAGIAFGAIALSYSATAFPILISSAVLVSSGIMLLAFGFEYKRALFPQQHEKEEHLFLERDFGDSVASLSYLENSHIPLLDIETRDPRRRGELMAELLREPFLEFHDRYLNHLPLALRLLVGPFWDDPLKKLEANIKAHEVRYEHDKLEELKGIHSKINEIIAEENRVYFVKRDLFSLDDVKAFITFADFNKGIGAIACSTSIRKNELIRTLDWFPFGVMGKLTLLKVYPTTHGDPSKPQRVASLTIPPGTAGLSMANENLVITLNEATTMESKRNIQKGTPQFLLTRELVENCKSLSEVKAYIKLNPPAASHILTVLDRKGNGSILQMLPTESDEVFTERKFNPDLGFVHTTNHFFGLDEKPIPSSSSSNSSFKRYQMMESALKSNHAALEVLKSVNQKYTIHSTVFTFENDGDLRLSLNFDNLYAAAGGQYEEINLSKLLRKE